MRPRNVRWKCNPLRVDKTAYDRRSHRDLPRDYCTVQLLLGPTVGPCSGLIHHHHVDPTDADSRTVQVCAGHHPKIHALLRGLSTGRDLMGWKTCSHTHRTREGREACERRLNRSPRP